MNSEAVTQNVVKILADNFELDQEITPSTEFGELELDSLIMLEISVIIERKYGVKIPEDELVEAGSVAGVVALIESRSSIETSAG